MAGITVGKLRELLDIVDGGDIVGCVDGASGLWREEGRAMR